MVSSPKDYAKTIEEIGIVPAKVAEKSLAKIKYVDLQGDALEEALDKFFEMLVDKNAELIGGKLPKHE